MVTKSYEDLMGEMKNTIVSRSPNMTDMTEGSNISTICEAVANIVEEAYIDTRIGYSNNLKQLATSIFNFKRKEGAKASVDLVFSRNNKNITELRIPLNTIVSDGSHEFITTSIGIINANELDSNPVTAIAKDIGVDFNVQKNSLTIIKSLLDSEIVKVTNIAIANGGADDESESDWLGRFKIKINGLQGTNEYGIKSGLLQLPDVRSVGIDEFFPPSIQEGSVYNIGVYIDDGTGSMTDELKNKINDLINGTDENQGLRACGVRAIVLPANQVLINISLTCYIYRVEYDLAKTEIENTIRDFINNLNINENVLLTDIILNLRQLTYVTDVQELLIGTSELGVENIIIGKNQIARMGNLDLVIEQV